MSVQLRARGCEAAGYRFSGAPLELVCCQHLYGNDRMLTVWPAEDNAMVILVAPHERAGSDVYGQLLDALNLTVPVDERGKPSCCDEEGRLPPKTSPMRSRTPWSVAHVPAAGGVDFYRNFYRTG